MNTLNFARIWAAALLAASSLAFVSSAHAVCAGQYPATHGEHGELPCYPQGAPAQQR